jgi:hypothetical protein
MSFTVKNGKIVRHDQARIDRFSRAIIEQTIQISEVEALNSKGGVIHIMCAHEDRCRTMKTGNGSDCTCSPTVTYHRHVTDADKH